MPLLKISFQGNPYSWLQLMREKGPRLVNVLATKMNVLLFQLGAYVQTEKLSGQALNPRTGKLRASVHAIPVSVQGTKLVGAVEAAGGPAFYGVVHESGGTREYEIRAVKARALAFIVGSKQRFAKSVIHPPIKQAAFMRPSLDENAEHIRSELQKSVDEVINERT
jgi:hypothetical protein